MATSVDAKLLRATKFPPEFNQKVDMQKVNVEVMKKWIAGKIAEILGNEDDVVIELCFNLVEGERFVCQSWADNCAGRSGTNCNTCFRPLFIMCWNNTNTNTSLISRRCKFS